MSVLYVSYDGLMEQLGQSQVLPYLRQLARGRPITLLTYEKALDIDDRPRRARFDAQVRAAGIRWIPLRYHRKPANFSTAYDLALGLVVCAFHCLFRRVRIVHARGYVPAVIALLLKWLFGVRFIFDMRGFWITQRVELGIWRENSTILRVARWFEDRFLRDADVVFALTRAAVDAMQQWPAVTGRSIRFEVVTTCTDLALFTPPAIHAARPGTSFTLGYVGNAGTGYLFEQVLEFFVVLRQRRPDARFKVVNRYDHAQIREGVRRLGIPAEAVDLSSCDHSEVPAHMWQMDAGVFFVRPDPSRISSVPTRLGEFLACGVPCVGNAGVGDVEEVLEGSGVGVAVPDFRPESLQRAAKTILELAARPGVRENCVRVARRRFSLADGVAIYEATYRRLEAAPT